MSATTIIETAPLGALIRYTDGRPKPPARFTKKLAAWERSNGVGRLVKKDPPRVHQTWTAPASFTLHEGNFSSDGVILVRITSYNVCYTKLLRYALQHKLDPPFTQRLAIALDEIEENYDLVVIDCPPQLGFTTMTALLASTGLLITVVPSMLDVASMAQFLEMAGETVQTLESYNFV